jgi:hypothetical protein
MRQKAFTLFWALVFGLAISSAGELFKWVDAEGTVHMTDNVSQIPPQYRNQVERRRTQISVQPVIQPESQGNGTASTGLKHFEIPYQAFEGRARRIIIPVTFNESIEAPLLLDTGSPGLMISPRLAKRLGLLDESETLLKVMTGGIGGATPAILAVVDTVRVGDARAEFLPATITQIPSNEFEGLVGMDFMSTTASVLTPKTVYSFDELPLQIDRPGSHDETWWRSNFHNFEKLRAEWALPGKAGQGRPDVEREERRIKISKEQYGLQKISAADWNGTHETMRFPSTGGVNFRNANVYSRT